MNMSSPQGALSGFQWHEPAEGLEFGEIFLGAMASIHLARGRLAGYGFLFTDRRIIGWKMHRIGLTLRLPEIAAPVGSLLISLYGITSGTGLAPVVILWLPLFLAFAFLPAWFLVRRFAERILSRRVSSLQKMLKRGTDFELRRDMIKEFLMQSPEKGWNLGGSSGYLIITPKDHQAKPIKIKIFQWKPAQRLRDLIINFSNREPKIRAMEYPS
jgi:hypothetical protein